MIGILALACLVTGFILGSLLRAIYDLTKISWSQEQMQTKVRYWQAETIRARNVATKAIYELATCVGHRSGPPDWPAPHIS